MIKSTKNSVTKTDASAAALATKKPTGKRVTKPKVESAPVATPTVETDASETLTTTAAPRTTKQNQVLTLLSQTGGVTIDEVMRATGWQEHSVRGFFAGTVRKKLGFELTSEKVGDDDRRYAIKMAA